MVFFALLRLGPPPLFPLPPPPPSPPLHLHLPPFPFLLLLIIVSLICFSRRPSSTVWLLPSRTPKRLDRTTRRRLCEQLSQLSNSPRTCPAARSCTASRACTLAASTCPASSTPSPNSCGTTARFLPPPRLHLPPPPPPLLARISPSPLGALIVRQSVNGNSWPSACFTPLAAVKVMEKIAENLSASSSKTKKGKKK
eukprot:441976-Hanusia_phi.AAC.1